MTETNGVICSNPECRVASTGKCLEGLAIDECPNYGKQIAKTSEDLIVEAPAPKAPTIALSPADSLTLNEVSGFLRAGVARIIPIIGPNDAGKTSLIASLYDLLQNSPVSGYAFAGSRTLHAFEMACHDARAASRRGIPHTERTPRGAVRFYHLALADINTGDRLALMLGDRSGEEYRDSANDISLVKPFVEIQRGDSLTILVDGEKLLDAGARHNLASGIMMMLQAMLEGGTLRSGQKLAVVLTKLDLVHASEHRDRVLNDFATLSSRIVNAYADVFGTVESFRIAASPKDDAAMRGVGVAELLAFWMKSEVPPRGVPEIVPPLSERAFLRLAAENRGIAHNV